LGEHATEVPFVIKRVAPSYSRVQTGIETLLKQRKLGRTDVGFDEISQWLIGNENEINGRPRSFATDFKVDSITCMGEIRSEGTSHGDETYLSDDIRCVVSSVTNRFTDGSGRTLQALEFHFHILALREKAEELKTPGVLRFCFGLFFVGCAIEVVAFAMERAETRRAESAENQQPRRAEPSAPPSGGPAEPPDSSGAGGGPPSVS
jgi:hypothetical protein